MLIPRTLKPELLRILHSLPEEAWAHNLWRQTLYKELEAGRCNEDEISAFEQKSLSYIREAVREAFSGIPSRLDTKAPEKRSRSRAPVNRTRHARIIGVRYVRRHSLDPFVSHLVSAGARATLLYLIARCGKHRAFKKQTGLVATDLGIAQRTVQAHYAALEDAGYIVRGAVDPKTGATPIRLTDAVEPPPFKPAMEPAVSSHEAAAQESAPTKPIKGESKTTYVRDVDIAETDAGSRTTAMPPPHEPGAELPRPAQPRARALRDDEVLDEAFRRDREAQRESNRSETIGLTNFDRHLDRILVDIACKHAERQDNRGRPVRRGCDDEDLESRRAHRGTATEPDKNPVSRSWHMTRSTRVSERSLR
ncbi:helix-turn-helix domain-containing protein [Methylobacterium frigidaeris]|uniref:Helix-turn-helix domain-containing protein n=1 Tax=Methylobacterium frigidaeris TaxID=2038277 RepID=A0AA37HHY1_9HYPH|nr:helix-turn-helix domain-containing protein [Methylobacterium frigidaeris]GJD66447.1 hypothetical protein MPEAHAMD_6645 [Methylobacterium frigidaeris]